MKINRNKFLIEFWKRQEVFYTDKEKERIKTTLFGVAGLGGNGGSVAESLVRLGAQRLIIADFDRVELNNLNRQPYFLEDVGKYKARALKKRLLQINPFVYIEEITEGITSENVKGFIQKADIIIDAVDNYPIKALISRLCKGYRKPYIHSAGVAFIGHVSTFLPDGPSYEELFRLPSLGREIRDVSEEEWTKHRYIVTKTIAEEFYPEKEIERFLQSGYPHFTTVTPCKIAGDLGALEAIKLCIGRSHLLIKAPKILRINTLRHEYTIIDFDFLISHQTDKKQDLLLQTSSYTCAPNAINYILRTWFNIIQSQNIEHKLWKHSALFPLKIGHKISILKTLLLWKLKALVVTENLLPTKEELLYEPILFERIIPEDKMVIVASAIEYAKEIYEELKLPRFARSWAWQKSTPTLGYIQKIIEKGGMCLVFSDKYYLENNNKGTYLKQHISHWIVTESLSKDKNKAQIYDPKCGRKIISTNQLVKAIDTSKNLKAPSTVIGIFKNKMFNGILDEI